MSMPWHVVIDDMRSTYPSSSSISSLFFDFHLKNKLVKLIIPELL